MLDCNGGLHILPGTPFEVNVNLRGLRHMANFAANEIRDRARCNARSRNWCAREGGGAGTRARGL